MHPYSGHLIASMASGDDTGQHRSAGALYKWNPSSGAGWTAMTREGCYPQTPGSQKGARSMISELDFVNNNVAIGRSAACNKYRALPLAEAPLAHDVLQLEADELECVEYHTCFRGGIGLNQTRHMYVSGSGAYIYYRHAETGELLRMKFRQPRMNSWSFDMAMRDPNEGYFPLNFPAAL